MMSGKSDHMSQR